MDKSGGLPVCYQSSTINKVDFDAFKPTHWLTSEAINFFYEFLITEDFPQLKEKVLLLNPSCCQVILFESDFDDLKDSVKYINFQQYQYIFIPVNNSVDMTTPGSGDHWALLIFEASTLRFFYFDSSHIKIENAGELAKKVISLYKNDKAYLKKPADILTNKTTPRQGNSFDCGMYVLAITEIALNIIKEGETKKLFDSDIFISTITPHYISQKRGSIRAIIEALIAKKLC